MKLTKRELECLEWIVQAYSEKDIAREMGVTTSTIRVWTHNIYRKAGINTYKVNPRVALAIAYVKGELESILEEMNDESNETHHVSQDEGICEEIVGGGIKKR